MCGHNHGIDVDGKEDMIHILNTTLLLHIDSLAGTDRKFNDTPLAHTLFAVGCTIIITDSEPCSPHSADESKNPRVEPGVISKVGANHIPTKNSKATLITISPIFHTKELRRDADRDPLTLH